MKTRAILRQEATVIAMTPIRHARSFAALCPTRRNQVSAGNPNGPCLRRGRPVPAEFLSREKLDEFDNQESTTETRRHGERLGIVGMIPELHPRNSNATTFQGYRHWR